MSLRPGRAAALAQSGAFVLLTVLAWGLFAPDRGFVQDEPWLLSALRRHEAAFLGFLWPGQQSLQLTPLRPLAGVPFALALLTPWPRLVLQLCFGLTWLWSGLLAARCLRLALPGCPEAALAAGALVLSACGDFSMNNLAYLTSFQAAALLLAALVEAEAFVLAGRPRSLWLALGALLLSLFTYDGTLAGALAAPVVLSCLPLAGARTPEAARRLRRALVAWLAVALPYALAFAWFMTRPGNYGARMIARPRLSAIADRALDLFALNLAPWRWAGLFVRPEDGTGPQALSFGWRLGLTLAGCAAVLAAGLVLASRARDGGAAAPRPTPLACARLALALLGVALVANAGVALVVDRPFRSQLVSRLFVSLALVVVCAALRLLAVERGFARAAPAAFLVALPFLFGGLQAGLASQDLYLTVWRRQRLELRSILEQAPGLVPDAKLLLYLPPGSPFTSLYYPGVGGPWIEYVYAPAPETLIWGQTSRGWSCLTEGAAFACRNSARADCYASGECQPRVLPFERTVLLAYARERGRFELQERLPAALAPGGDAGYAPRALIVERARSRWARELLDTPELAGAFFPGPAPP